MNQEEEIPTRVTRGALRRRSVDQEPTPQKPSGTAGTGTPKKTNSTTKRVNALNPIQESEGRPSTPIAGRNTRRRMSETIDTPTLPNKLVQNLKETVMSSEPGKRSRNTSLTEENLNELNEGSSGMLSTRSRTPARVRASHETLITTSSPLTLTPAVRRSTRRNSVTSDDGNISVQSLPITTPKMNSGLRALKDDTIIEEDAGDDRAESVSSENSVRQMRSHSSLSYLGPASPRSTTASPVLTAKHESTPPRTNTTPRVTLTPSSLSKMSPRSKNISFGDDTKREDIQSSFSKTPTSLSKKVFIVVEDLRNCELKGVSPKADAIIDISPKTEEAEKQEQSVNSSTMCENVEHDNQALNETVQSTNEEKTNASTSVVAVQNDECTVGKVSDNNVSGIDVLEASVKEVADTKLEDIITVNDSIRSTDQSLSEGNKFAQSWSQSVRRSATTGIDEYSIRKQEEEKRLEEAKESLQKVQMDSSFKASSPAASQHSPDKREDEEEDEAEMEQRNEFVDDEALEVEDYQSCDSLDDDLKREMEENEIPDHGEDLGSEDTEENDDQEDDEDENDSWVVSDDDEEALLRSSNEDLTSSTSLKKSKTINRRRIVDSEEQEEKENSIGFEKKSSPVKSPKSNTSIRRSVTPVSVLQTSIVETKENNLVGSLVTSVTDATPTKTSISPVKISSNKKQLSEPVDVESSEKEDEATDCSAVMFEDANEMKENGHQNDKEMENDALLSTSPNKIGTSRKSLPIDVANLKEPHGVADARKSLPASVKLQTDEKTDEAEVEPEIDNNENKEEIIDLEENVEVETSVYDDNKALNESSSSQVTSEQPVDEMSKLDRKSMPPISLVSAQFYIGETKKRNTVGGGSTNMSTSTPKQNGSSAVTEKKSVTAEKTNSKINNSIVPNPFALANGAKLKSRASLDSSTAIKQNVKKSRLSLPSKFVEEDVPSESGVGVNGSQEPEPMEVDEVIEEEHVANEEATKQNDNGEADDDVSVQEVQVDEKQRTKKDKPKPKPRAFEDYDLGNILVRCNDFMREEIQRKKQLASVLRKKKVEKKRLRELEKQEELELAKNATKTPSNNDADPNNANVSTGNDSSGQGEEPTKKKKKRKPKTKNYLLEELAETKKERLEQALRRKLQVIERRKQSKKDRQLEKKKQLNKENGDSANVTGGIGAKLEKMKKKQKAKTSDKAKAVGENESKDPAVRVAISAFAVFNQLTNNQVQLPSSEAAVDGNRMAPSSNTHVAVSPKEKKQLLKSPAKKESSDQQENTKEIVKTHNLSDVKESKKGPQTEPLGKKIENGKEKLLASTIERQTSSADTIAVSKKKQNLTVQPEDLLIPNNKMNPPLLQSASDGLKENAGKISKKHKKKQMMALASEGSENIHQKEDAFSGAHKISAGDAVKPVEVKVTAETKPYSNDEKPKEKKRKKEHVAELTLIEADSDIPKQKKNKKIKRNGAAEDPAKLTSAIGELRPEVEQSENINRNKKKLASQAENGAMVVGNTNELSRKKPTSVVKEPTKPDASIAPAKKRKREQQGDSSVVSTPRPAKHTKLRVLQRIESGGFFVENVTPDKVRLKRNFGFQERPATPAKQLGFKVTSILPTAQEELRGMATASKTYSKDGQKKSKFGDVVKEQNLSLPQPVWTSSGVFFESATDCNEGDSVQKKTHKSGIKQLKVQGKGEFNVKALRPGQNAEKPHRVDPTTVEQSVLNFKRQQLIEKTAHLRVKQKTQRV
ncbi:uncharacterized protein LOC125760774 [Anopheles funestus]|uniref:uncharacterized protein LOC125760774 n=1 Tax=Anopheles funestus TaxID=62324 RepID=UPI0020C60762|nr:uncharacterized protein LOC125760774 [Anopheles funestus]